MIKKFYKTAKMLAEECGVTGVCGKVLTVYTTAIICIGCVAVALPVCIYHVCKAVLDRIKTRKTESD